MNKSWARAICRLLIVMMAWTPYQLAHAGMIGTEQAVAAASQGERDTVLSFVTRSDVAAKLQALGLDPASAKARVAALSDTEVQYLAGKIESLPAGGDTAGVLLLILVLAAIWYVWRGGFR